MTFPRLCSVEECEKPCRGNNICGMHAQRMRRAARTPEQIENDLAKHRAVAAEHYPIKMKFLNDLKAWSGCVDCSYRQDVRALQFDHIDGSTKPKRMVQYTTIAAIVRNLWRVEVVCANCHCIRTFERGQNTRGRGRPRT